MNSIGKFLLFIAMGALNLPVAHAQTVKELELKIRCALKNTEACFNLGRMYSKGEGVRQDNSKAVEL